MKKLLTWQSIDGMRGPMMSKIGDKYIIEIAQEYDANMKNLYKDSLGEVPRKLYRIAGFNSLVFDEKGLEKLQKIDGNIAEWHFNDGYEQGYDKGLKEAWALAKIILDRDYYSNEIIFGQGSYPWIFSQPCKEIKKKWDQYKEKQDEVTEKQREKVETLIAEIGREKFKKLVKDIPLDEIPF